MLGLFFLQIRQLGPSQCPPQDYVEHPGSADLKALPLLLKALEQFRVNGPAKARPFSVFKVDGRRWDVITPADISIPQQALCDDYARHLLCQVLGLVVSHCHLLSPIRMRSRGLT